MNSLSRAVAAFIIGTALSSGAAWGAKRTPVLQQIDVPHNYYYREMYLPQVTSGPSSLSWSPDGKSLVYSMHGSLWQQDTDSAVAKQLTAGDGYDFQPDWSPNGEQIAFVRYSNDAVELWVLDIATGTAHPLTTDGAVNLEPRWSPDGARLAFVSTRGTGKFHIFIGELSGTSLAATRLTEDRRSSVERYYYSPIDHELSPAWLPDGSGIVYVGNPETPYGTGDIWQRKLAPGSRPTLVRREETSWKARPDVAPDGKRVVYASYLGRQWHQLWVTRIDGVAEPFPLTYGDFDITAPRWSPDGKSLAYISNESGDLAIQIRDFVGGGTRDVVAKRLDYLRPMNTLQLSLVDETGRAIPGRVSVVAEDGLSYAPRNAWLHADDEFDREKNEFETRYFHSDGQAELTVPEGKTTITAWYGPEHEVVRSVVQGNSKEVKLTVKKLDLPAEWDKWMSGDVHVHMNYGGSYRATPETLRDQARAEDLDVVFNLVVNKEQRIPDIAYFSTEPDEVSDAKTLLLHQQEFHTSFWGHMGLLGLDDHFEIPGYSAYPETAAASLYPDNATISRLAHEQHALVGYVHPFLAPPPNPDTDETLTNALPVDVGLGLVDYYEVVGFADHRASAQVWYGLLNCGARIAAAGGTDAMSNYASLRGPVGLNRTYVRIENPSAAPTARRDAWLAALQAGTSMATNGPLLALTVDGQQPGSEIRLVGDERTLDYRGFLRSSTPVNHVELVYNGKVVKTFKPGSNGRTADIEGSIAVTQSGWLLLRAWNDSSTSEVLDIYPYATTSPVYLTVDNTKPRSPADADYFLKWIDRIREVAAAHPDYNSAAERAAVLKNLDDAEAFYKACR
ncbi:MAG TPA: CehA/McbA family metallohydrolase [Woeseiaceae bacterium]|nr:CehA/McbA family metallohydrolase [Woeseiaceae bacterium]